MTIGGNVKSMDKEVSVWIVDDEQELANSCSEFLNFSHRTRVFHSAREALECFESEEVKPSIIVSDIKMPDIGGLEFVERVRQSSPGIPTIFMSGHADKEDLAKAFRVGASAYLEKPFDPSDLESIIKKIVTANNDTSVSERLLEEHRLISTELLRMYSTRYTNAENVIYAHNIDFPESHEQKLLYLESMARERHLLARIEKIENLLLEKKDQVNITSHR